MNKSCGGCKYFIMLKSNEIGGGLCELNDWRTLSDNVCKEWKDIKYQRKAYKYEGDLDDY